MDFTKDIYINKDIIYENSEIVVLYKGFLFSNNLTNELYISYGYDKLWNNKNEIKMKPSTFGYLATIKIDSGKNIQFCFRNNQGTWDNNNGENYILPIEANENILSFEPISETIKEINLDINSTSTEKLSESSNIFTPEVISSNPIELYETVNLENISKQSMPNNTIFTQINIDENTQKSAISKSVIQSKEKNETIYEEFAKITEKAKENSVKAFDENKVTAGSIYVNSIVKEIPSIENEENSLIPQDSKSLAKKFTFINTFFKNIKTAFSKLTTLIKVAFNLEDEDN